MNSMLGPKDPRCTPTGSQLEIVPCSALCCAMLYHAMLCHASMKDVSERKRKKEKNPLKTPQNALLCSYHAIPYHSIPHRQNPNPNTPSSAAPRQHRPSRPPQHAPRAPPQLSAHSAPRLVGAHAALLVLRGPPDQEIQTLGHSAPGEQLDDFGVLVGLHRRVLHEGLADFVGHALQLGVGEFGEGCG